MPSWSVDDRRALCAKPVQRTPDVVNFRDHEVDVMEHWTPTAYHSDAVMKRIGIWTHECQRFANAVGNAEVQHVAKEGNRFAAARRTEHDVAKPLNPGVGRLEGLIQSLIGWDIEFKRGLGVRFSDARGSSDLPQFAIACG
jgi:hypothetical protein